MGGQLGPHLAQWGLGRSLPPCQVASWFIQPFGHDRHDPKIHQHYRQTGQDRTDRRTDRQTDDGL